MQSCLYDCTVVVAAVKAIALPALTRSATVFRTPLFPLINAVTSPQTLPSNLGFANTVHSITYSEEFRSFTFIAGTS